MNRERRWFAKHQQAAAAYRAGLITEAETVARLKVCHLFLSWPVIECSTLLGIVWRYEAQKVVT
jgi:hypothetical protein